MHELDVVNEALSLALIQTDEIDLDDDENDVLVSNLQELTELMSKRQNLLDNLVQDTSFTDREYLQAQLDLTLKFKVQASKVMRHRQAILHSGKQGQRQINVYKTIDANR